MTMVKPLTGKFDTISSLDKPNNNNIKQKWTFKTEEEKSKRKTT